MLSVRTAGVPAPSRQARVRSPTSASWLNAVEGFFAKLTRQRLKRGVFKGIVDLQAAIKLGATGRSAERRQAGEVSVSAECRFGEPLAGRQPVVPDCHGLVRRAGHALAREGENRTMGAGTCAWRDHVALLSG